MVQKGSVVRLEYEAYTEDGELFDTTKKDVAKAKNQYSDKVVYEPLPVVVGAGRVLEGLDLALLDAKVGENREVSIAPAQAFGERDPAKVETIALREFQKQEVTPYPGMRVGFENRTGTVIAVTPGRVRIDFNPPLAGKSLRYVFRIVEEVEEPVARVKALVEQNYGQGRADDFAVEIAGDAVTIRVPDVCKYDQRWFVAKYRLVTDLRAYANLKTVRFVEEYVTELPPLPEAPERPLTPEEGGPE